MMVKISRTREEIARDYYLKSGAANSSPTKETLDRIDKQEKRVQRCYRCGCELSFKELLQGSGTLCAVCERNETERDNLRKIQQGNDDEQLGYTFSPRKRLMPMKFAYADPPYIGQAKRHYSHDPNCAEVDHDALIDMLMLDFPDGWALSASSSSLRFIVPILNFRAEGWRMAVWVKTFCAFKRNVRPAYGWEPVIFYGGRNPMNGHRAAIPEKNGKQTTPKDFILAEDCIAEPITLQKGLVGAKPEKVCRWILDLLNVQPGDEVVDLYPGTGIMGRVAQQITKGEITNEHIFQAV